MLLLTTLLDAALATLSDRHPQKDPVVVAPTVEFVASVLCSPSRWHADRGREAGRKGRVMLTRRMLLQGSASLAVSALAGGRANAEDGDPIATLQRRIDLVASRAYDERGIKSAIVAGVVTPEAP